KITATKTRSEPGTVIQWKWALGQVRLGLCCGFSLVNFAPFGFEGSFLWCQQPLFADELTLLPIFVPLKIQCIAKISEIL
ncbi:MAG: hypothetical protein VX438_07465, partial [Planctomycetota bacterium]|nr:hypothetical protein [Planctomycetota bacterium]